MRSEEELHIENQPHPTDPEVQAKEEPSLFDILNEKASNIDNNVPAEEEQIADNDEEVDQE